jgi:hypothetical protein
MRTAISPHRVGILKDGTQGRGREIMPFIRIRRTVIEIILIILFGSSTAYPFLTILERFSGHITPRMQGDTLIINYYLYSRRDVYDALDFHLIADSGQASNQSNHDTAWVRLHPITEDTANPKYGREWQGELRLPGNYTYLPKNFELRFHESSRVNNSSGGTDFVSEYAFYPTGVYGGRVNIGIASSIINGFPEPMHSGANSIILHLEDRRGYYNRYYTIFGGYSINYSKKFRLYDFARLEAEGIFWGRDRWMPIFHVTALYSSVKGVENGIKFIKKGFGAEVGVRFDGRFESLRYSYNTAVGGYHRADLVLAAFSEFGDKKIGTMYSMYHGKYVRMLALSVYMEGWGESDDETLQYHNNRLIIHQLLAVLALIPLLPIGLMGQG